jgi:hypothetical protein
VKLSELKEVIRKLPRYTTDKNAILYPDEKGELVEIGAVLGVISYLIMEEGSGQ